MCNCFEGFSSIPIEDPFRSVGASISSVRAFSSYPPLAPFETVNKDRPPPLLIVVLCDALIEPPTFANWSAAQ